MDRSTREAQLRSLGLSDEQITAALDAIENQGSPGRYFKHKEDEPFEVIGTVTYRGTKSGYKDKGIDPVIAVKHEGIPEIGEEPGVLNISTGLTAWKNAVNRENPGVGDVVSFQHQGLQESKKEGGDDYFGIVFTVLVRNSVSPTGGETAPF